MGIGRDLPNSLPGLAVEWNVEADSALVWNDNQNGAAYNDPELLTRLLQQIHYLPDKFDFLAEGKKVILAEVMATTYKKFLAKNEPPLSFPITNTAKARERANLAQHGATKGLKSHLLKRSWSAMIFWCYHTRTWSTMTREPMLYKVP